MNTETIVLGFVGALTVCVIVAGFSEQLASADPHQFDAVTGLMPTSAECIHHDASIG
jgi:hypothetical protein